MSDGKHTIKTDFGRGGPEREITFYECLKGNEKAKKTLEELSKSTSAITDLMYSIGDPEYRDKLLKVLQTINGLRSDLKMQFDGYIMY